MVIRMSGGGGLGGVGHGDMVVAQEGELLDQSHA